MLLNRLFKFITVFVLCLLSHLALAIPHTTPPSEQRMLSRLPQVFEDNRGQFDKSVAYIAQTPETFFAFSKDRVDLLLNTQSEHVVSLLFLGGNKSPSISGLNKTKQRVNYIRGKPSQWIENVDTFSKIEYTALYPGIDLQFYFNQTRMEFDFIVSPGINPGQIAFEVNQADTVKLNAAGELEIFIDGKKLVLNAPVIYQKIAEQRHFIAGSFELQGNRISFNIGDYDPQLSLIIDPIIEFSSYFGGEWEDQANVIKVDSVGNILLAGATSAKARITVANILTSESVALPVLVNVETGELFQQDHGISLADDIVAGGSLNLEVEDAYDCDYRYRGFRGIDRIVVDYDAFISKFDSNFNPIYTTYFGGCRNETIRAMAIDSDDNIYVTGLTLSPDFPTKSPAQSTLTASRFIDDPSAGEGDAIYAKFDKDGRLIFSSFLGGDGQDAGRDIAIDDDRNIYLIGYTRSLDGLFTTPCADVGTRAIACDFIGGINLDAAEEGSPDVSLFADVFIAKINATGDVIRYLSYFGGSSDDWGESIIWRKDGDDADDLDDIYIAGTTASPDLPLGDLSAYSYMPYNVNLINGVEVPCSLLQDVDVTGARQPDAHACRDAFVAKLSIADDGATKIQFLTYLGGDKDDSISAVNIDSQGNIYLFGTTESRGARLDIPCSMYPAPEDCLGVGLRESDKARAKALEAGFPLYKNLNDYPFSLNDNSTSAFFSVFNPAADRLIVSSFIAGNGNDTGNALTIREDPENLGDGSLVDIYLSGNTTSENFFTKNAFQTIVAQSDIFLVKLALYLSKSTDPYDPGDPDNPKLCSANSCNLYDIQYSTLLGGEDVDSVKSMVFLQNENSLIMSGVTFSRNFPVTSNPLKGTIAGIQQFQYAPLTREVIDQFIFYPSDMYLLKISDDDESVDLILSMSLVNTSEVKENDVVNYAIRIENKSENIARSTRLLVKYPYLAKLTDIEGHISIDEIDADNCVIDILQMYCLLGDVSANEERNLTLSVRTRSTGNFLLSTSVSSMTANTGNNVSQSINVNVKGEAGSISVWLLLLLGFIAILRATLRE